MIEDLAVKMNPLPIVEVDFSIEEYSIPSRRALKYVIDNCPVENANDIVVGKNLMTGELIAVPYHLRDCRISRKRKFASSSDHERTDYLMRSLRGQ
jgi:hypothetical protein